MVFLPFPDEENAKTTMAVLQMQLKTQQVAACIVEPLIQGAGGMRMYASVIYDEILNACRKHGVLTIADEVMTGFGRTGKLFASDHVQSKPDIVCLSKGITGGVMPLGATLINEKIVKPFLNANFENSFFHGHSYTGNAMACAVANASWMILTQDQTLKKIEWITIEHSLFVKKHAKSPKIKNIRSLGTILAFEYLYPETGYAASVRTYLYEFFLKREILLRPLGNTVYFMPPYCIEPDQLQKVYTAIEELIM